MGIMIRAINRMMMHAPKGLRALWQRFHEWYAWRCDICGKRSGPMQLTNVSLRCQAHRLVIPEFDLDGSE
jgi:hypothetical protein